MLIGTALPTADMRRAGAVHRSHPDRLIRPTDEGRRAAAVNRKSCLEGHYGLRGTPERATLIDGKLAVWSEVGAGNGDGAADSSQHRLCDCAEALLVVTAFCHQMPADERGDAS